MSDHKKLHLFDAFGVELEYMIVDQTSLNVLPISHHLLSDETGAPVSEVEQGACAWSNELTHHVIEIKTNGPRSSLAGLAEDFQQQVGQINKLLTSDNACLLPTGMHPWMNPDQELRLWPYDYSPVYTAFHKVFDCRGHGWANLQSMHINLPFCGDKEFGKLHAAVRLVLPLLPGIAASSPWCNGRSSGFQDTRLHAYANNSRRIPSVTARVIPEPVYSESDYLTQILRPMYAEIAPLDSEVVLQEEFLNARGAIARFDRGAIEIRVIDVQECPLADVAIAALTIAVLKKLVNEDWSAARAQQQLQVEPLRAIFDLAVLDGEHAVIDNGEFLETWGCFASQISVGDLWRELFDQVRGDISCGTPEAVPVLEFILSHGTLARRMQRASGEDPDRERMLKVCQQLARCLAGGHLFQG